MNFVIVFYNSVKKFFGNWIGVAPNKKISLGRTVIFIILARPTHEHSMFFQLFRPRLILRKVFCNCVHIIPVFDLADGFLSILYCLGGF